MPNKLLIHFATNRNRTNDAAMFGSGFADLSNPDVVIYGTVSVAFDAGSGTWQPDPSSLQIDPTPKPGVALARRASASAPAATPAASPTPAPNSVTDFVSTVTTSRATAQSASKTVPGLIFVHGYNTTFVAAITGAAQLASQHQIAHMFVFSFPSFGNFLLYGLDGENAGKSHAALADVITHLFDALQPHAQRGFRLELLCHSLGNFVLSGAFKIMTDGHPSLRTTYFRHAIHAAADVSADAFSQRDGLAQVVNLADEIDIYTNSWDRALAASFALHILPGDPYRLGAVGPQYFQTLPIRVIWIDCSQVAGNSLLDLGHGYYASAPAVIADLDQVLKGRSASTIQPRRSAGASNHFLIPVDDHTTALVRTGRGNSLLGHA